MLKYEITDEYLIHNDRKVYRIRALRNFSDVLEGTLGGYVENKHNLSQFGNCFIYDQAIVMNRAHVKGDSKIKENVCIYSDANIKGKVTLRGRGCFGSNAFIGSNDDYIPFGVNKKGNILTAFRTRNNEIFINIGKSCLPLEAFIDLKIVNKNQIKFVKNYFKPKSFLLSLLKGK